MFDFHFMKAFVGENYRSTIALVFPGAFPRDFHQHFRMFVSIITIEVVPQIFERDSAQIRFSSLRYILESSMYVEPRAISEWI